MPSFGENLRREREMRGVSLEEISASSKINVRFLQALEENEFGKLPGGIFTRSFIRAYARYLGLDEERVMAEYQMVAPQGEVDLNRFGAPKPLPTRSGARTSVVIWLIAAGMLVGGYALFRYSHRAAELEVNKPVESSAPKPPAPMTTAAQEHEQQAASAATPSALTSSAPAGETGAVQNTSLLPTGSPAGRRGLAKPANPGDGSPVASGSDAQQGANPVSLNPSAAPKPSESPANPAPAKGALGESDLILQVATTERVWLAVNADGTTVFQRTLDPNAVETFHAKDYFDVTTGNAQGTILTLNGETQKPLGRHGELKKLHLSRANLQKPVP